MKKLWIGPGAVLLVFLAAGIIFAVRSPFVRTARAGRHQKVMAFIRHPEEHQDWVIEPRSVCGGAPFLFPTRGFIGYLWGDSFKLTSEHQGLDIFSGTDTGLAPVVAAYDGYLTREAGWKSSLILRIPHDPLHSDQQIWLYYTHMADRNGNSLIVTEFPPGTAEVVVKAGTLLGYQGNYSGDPENPVGVHLHFSIVKDDGNGKYLNELHIENTLDPSPYLGMPLNGRLMGDEVPSCEE